MPDEDYMVQVVGAYKRYGYGPPVLAGLNMNVKKGTIYSLLGPSGCGKTTLLGCIVSRVHLDAGYIELGIKKKSDIGFMPQEIALFPECSIKEIFSFYGTLYGMHPYEVKKRRTELMEMLNLPPPHRFLHTLSGGQQRRVSFAVALLHNPPLLILDEPTVGMDPILCNTIWEYLVKIATENQITIIITTHYIEEAKPSHMIGLMRKGVLLTEEPPKRLMERTDCDNLEEAFLALSTKQSEQHKLEKNFGSPVPYPKVRPNSAPLPLKNNDWFNYHRFIAQLQKNIRWTHRNKSVILFLLFLPAFISFMFCLCFGHDPKPVDLPIGFVSDELSYLQSDCHSLNQNYTYSSLLECNISYLLSCEFINRLNETLNVKLYDDLSAARMDVSTNKIWGVLQVSKNFSNAVEERIGNGLDTTDISIDNSVVSIWMDMSSYIMSYLIKRNLRDSIENFVKGIMQGCGIVEKVGSVPVKFNDAIYGNNTPIWAHSTAPAFLCSFIFYFTMSFTSGAVYMERMVGIIERIMVAGMTAFEITSAHLVVQFVMMTLQSTFMIVILHFVYTNPFEGNVFLSTGLLFLVAVVGITFGYFVAELFEEEKMSSYSGIGMILAIFMLGGLIWPVDGAHVSIKSWSRFFPLVAAIDGYAHITLKGHGFFHRAVFGGYVSCVSWIAIFSGLTMYLSKKRKGS